MRCRLALLVLSACGVTSDKSGDTGVFRGTLSTTTGASDLGTESPFDTNGEIDPASDTATGGTMPVQVVRLDGAWATVRSDVFPVIDLLDGSLLGLTSIGRRASVLSPVEFGDHVLEEAPTITCGPMASCSFGLVNLGDGDGAQVWAQQVGNDGSVTTSVQPPEALPVSVGAGAPQWAWTDEEDVSVQPVNIDGDGVTDWMIRYDDRTCHHLGPVSDPLQPAPCVVGSLDTRTDVAFGDLDGDGRVDAVITESGRSSVVYGPLPENSAFDEAHVVTWGDALMGPRLRDLDGDGDLEIVGADLDHQRLHAWDAPRGAMTWDAPDWAFVVDARWSPVDVHAGDLDGDGHIDLVVQVSSFAATGPLQGTSFFGIWGPVAPGDVDLDHPSWELSMPTGSEFIDGRLHDFDRDGRASLVVTAGSFDGSVVYLLDVVRP